MASSKSHLDFVIDSVKQLYVDGETIDKQRTKIIRYPNYDPSTPQYFENSHTYQFVCDDYLYIFMGANSWHSFNNVLDDHCLMRIKLDEITRLYEETDKIAVEEVKTYNACYGGRIFPGFYYDNDLKQALLYGGLKQGRVLSNEFYLLSLETFRWRRFVSFHFVPPMEGQTIVKRRDGEYYVYGGHGGNLVFTNSFYRVLLNTEEGTVEFQDMKKEKMLGYEHVTSTVAYHQSLYFEKIDAMVVFGGKLRSGENAPMSNDLLIFYFKTNTWIKVESTPIPCSSPLPPFKKIPDEFRVVAKNLWVKTPKTRSHNMVKISPTKLLSFGGTCNTRDQPDDFTRDVLIFDVEELTWTICDTLSNYDPDVLYLVNTKHSTCLEGVERIFGQDSGEPEQKKSSPHELDPAEFDETFVGRNYFSMCLDPNRNNVYIFGGSTCSRGGTSRSWESSSLIKFHFDVRPTISKVHKMISTFTGSTDHRCHIPLSDISIKTIE